MENADCNLSPAIGSIAGECMTLTVTCLFVLLGPVTAFALLYTVSVVV